MGSVKHNWNADDYANNSSAQLQWAEELITKLALRGSESLLDIGCGDGKITAQLAHVVKNGRVLGIDSSESMIQRASEQFPPTTNPNLSFLHMDATEIHLSQRFDVAFSLYELGGFPRRLVRGFFLLAMASLAWGGISLP
jgi:trans-aconitate 2-methyltransferase